MKGFKQFNAEEFVSERGTDVTENYAEYISKTRRPGRRLTEELDSNYHSERTDHHASNEVMNSHDIKAKHYRDHGHLPHHAFDDEHESGVHVSREHGGKTYHGPGGGKVTNFHHEHVYQHGGQKGMSYHSPTQEKSLDDVHKIVKKSNPHMSNDNAMTAAKHIFRDHQASA